MPTARLPEVPRGADVFVDANIFIYGLTGKSPECTAFLERCSTEEIIGVTLLETVNEATHRFMMAEAFAKGIIPRAGASQLKKKWEKIPTLTDYWHNTERLLSLNVLFIPLEESTIRNANVERTAAGLMTNDSMIVSCMRQLGLASLASRDSDFSRVAGITVFQPTDLPSGT